MTDRDPTRRPGGTMRVIAEGAADLRLALAEVRRVTLEALAADLERLARFVRAEAFVRCLVPGCRRPRWPRAYGVCRAHRAAELAAERRLIAETDARFGRRP